jgi:predicted ferric reductase
MTLTDTRVTPPGERQPIMTTAALQPSSPRRIATRFKARLRRGDMLEVLMYFSLALVMALFFADKGATYFTNPSRIATGLGIVAGLIGSDLLLIMLLLAARLPIIDNTFGHDKALATHRKLGKPVFYLIIAHMVLLLIGYGVAEGLNPFAEIFSMIANGQDMLKAYAGFALMAVVIVTSLVIVRKKLPYEFWYVVHLLSYAAVILALPHQFTNGQLFAEGTWARPYWLALFIGTFALITIYRVIVPIARTAKHQLRVTDVRLETPDVITITMTGRDLDKLPAKGGQFMNWRFWQPNMLLKSHPFSFSAAPDGKSLRITVRNLGRQTNRILKMKVGTPVSFEGPYGLFTEDSRTTTDAVLIGSGIGITPIRALLEDPRFAGTNISVILRGGTNENVYLWQEVYDLCVAKNAWLRVLVGHRPRGVHTWLSAEAFNKGERLSTLAPNIKEADVYICGPAPWMDLVIADAKKAGVKPERIHAERFDF